MKIINMGGQISFADFGQFSVGVYTHSGFISIHGCKIDIFVQIIT